MSPNVKVNTMDWDSVSLIKIEWILRTCDPYTAPADVFIALKLAKFRPDLEFGDIYIYYRESVTAQKMKAYKSTDSYIFFQEWMG